MTEESADSTGKRIGRLTVVVAGAALAAAAAWVVFVDLGSNSLARLLAVLLVLAAGVAGARLAGRLAASLFAPYNVAEVAVEGPITRGGGGRLPWLPGATSADDVVEQIRRADRDDRAGALVVRLNTPGGEVVPSDDLRLAAERFDGPTVAYATDTCASGGYWIASGCDRLFAREGSVVGSIGVIASRVTVAELAERLGVSYERLAAGRYKDAGTPFRELSEDDRAYLQGIVDGYYETFLDRVTAGRELDRETVRETEARVYLGEEARDVGLVDELGTMEDVEDHLADRLGEPVSVREFEPTPGLRRRLGAGAATVAYALGAGAAGVLAPDGDVAGFDFEAR